MDGWADAWVGRRGIGQLAAVDSFPPLGFLASSHVANSCTRALQLASAPAHPRPCSQRRPGPGSRREDHTCESRCGACSKSASPPTGSSTLDRATASSPFARQGHRPYVGLQAAQLAACTSCMPHTRRARGGRCRCRRPAPAQLGPSAHTAQQLEVWVGGRNTRCHALSRWQAQCAGRMAAGHGCSSAALLCRLATQA